MDDLFQKAKLCAQNVKQCLIDNGDWLGPLDSVVALLGFVGGVAAIWFGIHRKNAPDDAAGNVFDGGAGGTTVHGSVVQMGPGSTITNTRDSLDRAVIEGLLKDKAVIAGQRIQYLFEELGDLRQSSSSGPIASSRVAEAIGWSHAEPLESWLAGENEPSFQELSAIATVTGCGYDWLAHGEGVPFPSRHKRLDSDVRKAVLWLTSPMSTSEPAPQRLMIVRNESETGELAFVKQFSDWSAQVYTTPYHVSGMTGSGGKADLAWLALALERMCRGKLPFDVSITGYLASTESYNELTEGRRHPINVMRNRGIKKSTWWEDIWDPSMIENSPEYWPGWKDLMESSLSDIENTSRLKAERKAMRASGFLTDD